MLLFFELLVRIQRQFSILILLQDVLVVYLSGPTLLLRKVAGGDTILIFLGALIQGSIAFEGAIVLTEIISSIMFII